MSHAGKFLGADDKIDALDNQLVIVLLSTLTWRCRFAHKVVRIGHQLHVEIYVRKNKAFVVGDVQVRSNDEFDNGISRDCRGACVENSIVPTDCGDINVPDGVLCPFL